MFTLQFLYFRVLLDWGRKEEQMVVNINSSRFSRDRAAGGARSPYRLAKRLLPAKTDFAQIGVVFLEPAMPGDVQLVHGIRQQIDRRPDGHVRLHR